MIAVEKSPLSNQEPFEVQEANNVSLIEDAKVEHDEYEGYCFLCCTISKIALKIRKKFTKMVAVIIFF